MSVHLRDFTHSWTGDPRVACCMWLNSHKSHLQNNLYLISCFLLYNVNVFAFQNKLIAYSEIYFVADRINILKPIENVCFVTRIITYIQHIKATKTLSSHVVLALLSHSGIWTCSTTQA